MIPSAAGPMRGPTPRIVSPWSWLVRRRRAPFARTLFLAVRSVSAEEGLHELEVAIVDDGGTVCLCSKAKRPSPVGLRPDDPPIWPGAEATNVLDMRLSGLCRGARLVAFHRLLQCGLLPPGIVAGSAGVSCAWRRFLPIAQRRGLRPMRGEPLQLNDCLAHAGLPPPCRENAAERALAVRALWLWMDANQ